MPSRPPPLLSSFVENTVNYNRAGTNQNLTIAWRFARQVNRTQRAFY